MLALIQRVKEATVTVDGNVYSRINQGLLVLLGIFQGDTEKDADYIARKILNLRIFPEREQDFHLSVKDISGKILLVSQFTLAGDCKKGRRPSFSAAMEPDKAKILYNETVKLLKKHIVVETGAFGAHMDVGLINNGPVTLIVDSKKGVDPSGD